MTLIFALMVPAFAILGLGCLTGALLSVRPYLQVLRRPTTRVGSLAEGSFEVAGVLTRKDAGPPLLALDRTPALVVRTRLAYSYRSGGKTYSSGNVLDDLEAVEIELTDATGACSVDTTSVTLLGERRNVTYKGSDFKEAFSDLWDKAGLSEGKVVDVSVEQIVVKEGVTGLASGEAEREGDVPGDDYRSKKTRYRLTSTLERPLILSAFSEPSTRSILLRPAWTFAAIAVLSFAVAGAMTVAALRIGE